MTIFLLWNKERFFLNPQAPEWECYNPIRWQLLPHKLGGTMALLFGAME